MSQEQIYNIMISVVGFLSVLIKQHSSTLSRKEQMKQLNEEMKSVKINMKRIELNQAIDHDFGSKIVIELLDEYHALGGNSYMTTKAQKYLMEKEDLTHAN